MEELTGKVKLTEVGNWLDGQVPCRTFCHVFLCNFICLFSEIGSNVARKERRHYVLLKAVYSGTFQHACMNLSPGIVSCVSLCPQSKSLI